MKRRLIYLTLIMALAPWTAHAKIFLPDTNTSLELITASAVSTIYASCSYVDITTTTIAMGATDSAITTATTTTIVAAPGASTERQIKGCTFKNSHASSSNAITLQRNISAVKTPNITYTLLAGETLEWTEDGGFKAIDASGQMKALVTADTELPAASSTPNSGSYAAPTAPDVWSFLMCKNSSGSYDPCLASPASSTPCYVAAAATTNATNCKASAGQISGYEVYNTTTTIYYLRLYNLASAPTCSSATGFIRSIPIPASASGNGAIRDFTIGEAYSTGIGFCITGGASSTDNTSAATGVFVTVSYN